jgi:peptide/nickel transport system permease protein
VVDGVNSGGRSGGIPVAPPRIEAGRATSMWYRMARLVGVRVLLGLLTLFCVSAVIFFAVDLLPGDFASEILGQSATPETVAQFRKELGLDEPALYRYGVWLLGFLHGDFGTSYSSQADDVRSVASLVVVRLWNTLFLAGATAVVAVPLAVTLGIVAALYRNSWLDRTINGITLTSISCPEFFMAYVLMLFLAVRLHIFPSLATIEPGMPLLLKLYRIALPVMTLTLVITAHMMRMTRSAIIGVLAHPYIEMARCKGISPARIIVHHALPNAWAPIANVIAFNLSYLIVGVVVVEIAFVYPGVGQTMVDAVRSRDVPVIQACALIFATTYIVLNLIADIVAIATNPRLMYPR